MTNVTVTPNRIYNVKVSNNNQLKAASQVQYVGAINEQEQAIISQIYITAGNASQTANNAVNLASGINDLITEASESANTAYLLASEVNSLATNASNTANTAYVLANEVNSLANNAYESANLALETINSFTSVINGGSF